jgi:hypothetical protein
MALILGGLAAVLGVACLIPLFQGDFIAVPSAVVCLGYAAWAFLVMTSPDVPSQPSET